MKRIICAVLVLVLALSLVACSPREVISAEEFVSRMEGAGHTVEDFTSLLGGDDSGATAAFIADCGAFETEFFVFETEAQAQAIYNQIQREFENMRGNVSSHTEVNVSNYSRFRQTSDGMFKVVSRVENTMVVVVTDSDNQSDVDAVLDLLGY